MRAYLPAILGTLGTGLAGVLIYWLRTRIDRAAGEDRAEIQARQTPLQVLQAALAKRDQEVEAGRAQLYIFINNHLAHDAAERESLAKTLTGIQQEQRANLEVLKSMAASLEAHRAESAAGRGALHERINHLTEEVIRRPA